MTSGVPTPTSRNRGRRAALTALLAGALVASGIVVATTGANPAGASPTFQSLGTITLQTRSGVTTATLGTSSTQTQTFTTSGQCQLSSSGANLLRLSGTVGGSAGNVGFQTGTFGVAEKPSGTSCVEVNNNKQTASEVLSIKLGGSDAFPLVANSATLDIEAKGTGAQANVAFYLKNAQVGTRTIDCNATSSDAGPDAKNGDNCTDTVAPTGGSPFDEIRLSASPGAAISLEGGQDWVGTGKDIKSTFDVGYYAENPVSCQSSTVTVAGSSSTPSVQIRDIGVSSGTCSEFIYSLTSTGGKATFLKPYSDQSQRLQFMMDLGWEIPAGATAELPKVFFGFHDANLAEGTARELGWCADSSFELSNGVQPTITSAMDVETNQTLFPGVQYACMASSVLERDLSGKPVKWLQSIYVHGDAYARR